MQKKYLKVLFSGILSAALAGTAGCGGGSQRTSVPPAEGAAGVVSFQKVDETMAVFDGEKLHLNAYRYPTTNSEVYAVMEKGELLHVIGKSRDWACAEADGEQFYLMLDQVADPSGLKEDPEADEEKAQETARPDGGQPEATSSAGTEAEDGGIEEIAVSLSSDLKYAEFSKISTGAATLYKNHNANRKDITVCVNAGHGTKGGGSVKTLCHPDGTPKVTGGSTAAGQTSAAAVSSGMTFLDGTPEAKVTLRQAVKLKERLLDAGYSVLMIRESDDVQLDNVARTVLANNYADCHVAIHWDSSESDKGAFYLSVPGNESYRSMEPVASTWKKSNRLGDCLVQGLRSAGRKIYGEGAIEMDLTQTAYSSVASVDIELGDKGSDYSDEALNQIADGLKKGIDLYFES